MKKIFLFTCLFLIGISAKAQDTTIADTLYLADENEAIIQTFPPNSYDSITFEADVSIMNFWHNGNRLFRTRCEGKYLTSNKSALLKYIEITRLPTKVNYYQGEAFDKSGLVVEAVNYNGDANVITDYTLTWNDSELLAGNTDITASEGRKTITVAYKEKESSFDITVAGIDDGSDGTEANPYSVAQILAHFALGAAQENDVYVSGYIVGGIAEGTLGGYNGTMITDASHVVFGATGVRPASVVIADDSNETNWENVVLVKLTPETGAVALEGFQWAISLANRPCNIGKELTVKGNLWRYFAAPAVREVSAFESNSEPCPDEDGIFSETLLSQESFDKFTPVSVTGDQVWTFSTDYGAMMSGYNGSASDANEDWFITPDIDLSEVEAPVLSFDHARGPAFSINVGVAEGWYKVYATANYTGDVETTTWIEVTGVTHGTTAWKYVSSGSVAIPAAAKSATTRIAFKYFNDATESATWEIKNVLVK
ncbi:MAG: DUF6359 domain-containing protein [Bacteroidales bacterium]|jgi:uncharacterized protein YkuJ|nr:DUF6359 domain-containing protein [Bacteroidales bacterium]